MSARIGFYLRDEDLRQFEERAQQTQANARSKSPEEIIADARAVMHAASRAQLAGFVRERFSRLGTMLEMVNDPEWLLAGEDRQRLLNALACFSGSHSSASDDDNVVFLDHSIMIELVSRDLEHDLAAYRDFCSLRISHAKRHRSGAEHQANRELWLQQTRESLQHRMHLRRTRSLQRGGSSVRRLFSLLGI
jgi:hypothetical protein